MMENTETLPLISVIVPVYNVKHYIGKCLQSICGQTYKNLEIIVVDDGSTDGSGEICDSFARLDLRVKVIHQSNGGQSAARNSGLLLATGKYLGFVDGDDWIDADMYESLFRLMVEADADISVFSHYKEKQGKTIVNNSSGKVSVYTRDEALRALVEDKRIRNYVWDKLFKRNLFKDISFPLNRVFEDIAISYRVFYRAKKVVVQDTPKYHYVVRDGSAMQSAYNPLKEHNLFQGVYEQVHFVMEKGIWGKTAAVYVLRRGIRLIDHVSMLEPSPVTKEVVADVLDKMHEFDDVKTARLGFSLAVKRWLIYHDRATYRVIYRCVRSLFKSKRHRF